MNAGEPGGSGGGSGYYAPGAGAADPQPVPSDYTAYGNAGGNTNNKGNGGGGAGRAGQNPGGGNPANTKGEMVNHSLVWWGSVTAH